MFHSLNPAEFIKGLLSDFGLTPALVSLLTTLVLICMVVLTAWLSKLISRAVIVKVVTIWVKRTRTTYDDIFLESRVFHRIAFVVPGIVIWYMASWLLRENVNWLIFIHRTTEVYIVLIVVLTLNAFVEAWYRIYMTLPVSEGRSIKGYVQLAKALIIIGGIMVGASVIFSVSVTNVVAGLGVASAALLIVFRDTLLGLVASMQLSTNKMLRLGDWITIPGRNVDGTVIDMSLHTVKVKNFDNTILTVPTYALVSESFQNWKGMEQSGVRRIKKEIRIDVRSIKLLQPMLLEKIRQMDVMESWLEDNSAEAEAVARGEVTTLTNLTAFRAFLTEYLRTNKYIDNELPIMVRDMNPADAGLPVEIYCFSRINQWVPYEAVQSAIMDYIFAVVGKFDLRPFQNPSGSDIDNLGKTDKHIKDDRS